VGEASRAHQAPGIGIALFDVPWFTAIQREVEPRLLARASSVDFPLSDGLAAPGPAMPVSGTRTFSRPA
jgi:hypothetical protein